MIRYFIPIFLSLLIIACQDPPAPEYEPHAGFVGQLETDIDYAIIKPDGTLWTWGGNTTGQLGDGTMNPSDTPKQITSLAGLVSIDLSDGGAYAVDGDGNIWYWGNRIIWDEGPDDITILTPTKISSLPGTKQLRVLGSSIYILRNDGTVWHLAWNHSDPVNYLAPELVDNIDNIRLLSGELALGSDGVIYELPNYDWVSSENGGLDDQTISSVIILQNTPRSHTIIIKSDSTVWAWGKNKGGYLGNGTYDDNPTPTRIDTLSDIMSISANGSRCLALSENGLVWFWGMIDVDYDHGIFNYQNTPAIIEEISDIKMIHASAARCMLFVTNDDSYWSYDVKTSELEELIL